MFFAESDANFWVIVLGAVFLGISKIVSLVLDYQRNKDQIARDELARLRDEEKKDRDQKAAQKVADVKTTLAAATVAHEEAASKQIEKLEAVAEKIEITAAKTDAIAEKIEVVHQATNGIKAELVEEVRRASFAEGVKSETDRRGAL